MDEAIRIAKERIDRLKEMSYEESPYEYTGRMTEALALLSEFEFMRKDMIVTSDEARELDALDLGTLLLDKDLVYWIKGENGWFSNTGILVNSAVNILNNAGIKWFADKSKEEDEEGAF